jgi:predicted O-methyltransferase YrrM
LELFNIITHAFNPKYLPEMTKKVFKRIFGKKNKDISWYQNKITHVTAYCSELNNELWQEALNFASSLESRATEILPPLGVELGGGGHYTLLYFLVRVLKPKVVVETGVAAGYSSQAILSAMNKNENGMLYSSDFPYFRLSNPEKYIGVLVENKHRHRWRLFIEGDSKNLPQIVRECGNIDIFHYDSDKSYSGRSFACNLIQNTIAKNGILIMDDIQDDTFFKDFVILNGKNFQLFEFKNKYVGVVGMPKIESKNN